MKDLKPAKPVRRDTSPEGVALGDLLRVCSEFLQLRTDHVGMKDLFSDMGPEDQKFILALLGIVNKQFGIFTSEEYAIRFNGKQEDVAAAIKTLTIREVVDRMVAQRTSVPAK